MKQMKIGVMGEAGHDMLYESSTLAQDVVIFAGSGLMGREFVNIHSSDIVVIFRGSSGTLGELAIADDKGKLIGVVTGTGGISDMIRDSLAKCNKETGARVMYDADPHLWSAGIRGLWPVSRIKEAAVAELARTAIPAVRH
jgi:delta 1-pyrroline-5-carboxylate dehydrogenase